HIAARLSPLRRERIVREEPARHLRFLVLCEPAGRAGHQVRLQPAELCALAVHTACPLRVTRSPRRDVISASPGVTYVRARAVPTTFPNASCGHHASPVAIHRPGGRAVE